MFERATDLLGSLIGILLLVGCQPVSRVSDESATPPGSRTARKAPAETTSARIKFLYFDGCPMSPEMRDSLLTAMKTLGLEPDFEPIDLAALAAGDPLLRYGAPTLLVDDQDLMGQPPSSSAALACRIYPTGVPTSEEIAQRLPALLAGGDSSPSVRGATSPR